MNKDVRLKGFAKRCSVDEAIDWIHQVPAHPKPELVPLRSAAGRVLAESVSSQVNVPGFRRAMMDGYAVQAADVLGANSYNPIDLQVVGEVLPGTNCPRDIGPSESMLVMTGAEVPPSADAVVPVEFTEQAANRSTVSILSSIAEQKNIARIGEDIAQQSVALPKYRRLRPQDVGLLSSIGVKQVPVIAQPTVRIIVTGNELLPAGESPSGVQVVDSNSVMLEALIRRDGGQPDFPGILPDQADKILAAMREPADVILVAGGSSTGKEDFAPTLIAEHGDLAIHGIAMRPSSPAGMGTIADTPVFLLPGNPVSCLCAYDFFARILIRKLSGLDTDWPYPKRVMPLRKKISSKIGRTDYARVQVIDDQVEPIAISGASILSSTSKADGFCLVPEASEGFAPQTEVTVYFYDGVNE